MPITPFLRGRVFEPETLKNMSEAFLEACREIGLKDRDDKMTALVARHVVALAERGISTKTDLYLLTVQEFRGGQQ